MLDVVRLRVLLAVARKGSVTAAAKELHYSQPSVSHHLARLEAETGARLVQRVGRGIRLTEAGWLLAERAAEIIGRLDDAAEELAAHVGLRAGRVRLAAFPSSLGTFVPRAVTVLKAGHPGLRLDLTEAGPPEALRLLRAGRADVAVIFRYDDTAPEERGITMIPLMDDPGYLVADRPVDGDLAAHADASWIAGCERCRTHLLDVCARAGFAPRVSFTSDDIVAVQALVASGLGLTMLPGLALRAHRHPGVEVAEIAGSSRHVYAAVLGEPPHPPPVEALLHTLRKSR
ncbi:LysR family transcriptional regulator [Nonomuraea bangladeshensis]|uniref:LysR family transcriptional regulator n=1 Tax=Nonomuraea bangladeshensis TaxID=404385 RepID=UPI0031CFCB7C